MKIYKTLHPTAIAQYPVKAPDWFSQLWKGRHSVMYNTDHIHSVHWNTQDQCRFLILCSGFIGIISILLSCCKIENFSLKHSVFSAKEKKHCRALGMAMTPKVMISPLSVGLLLCLELSLSRWHYVEGEGNPFFGTLGSGEAGDWPYKGPLWNKAGRLES